MDLMLETILKKFERIRLLKRLIDILKNEKNLVTGGAGFIGSNLIYELDVKVTK